MERPRFRPRQAYGATGIEPGGRTAESTLSTRSTAVHLTRLCADTPCTGVSAFPTSIVAPRPLPMPGADGAWISIAQFSAFVGDLGESQCYNAR
jgi:hypothetical protein